MVDVKLVNLKIGDLLPNLAQPRREFDPYELKYLAESIKENGILQPLIVRPSGDGKYLLIAGERRLRAAAMIGLKKLPCIVRKIDPLTADIYTLAENLRQEKLSPFEEAEGILKLIKLHGISAETAAMRLGISTSRLEEKLSLLSLSEGLRQRLSAARLTERHARALLRIKSEARTAALDHVIAHQLTVPETEHYVETLLCPSDEKPEKTGRCAIGDLRLFSNSLTKLVDTMRAGGVPVTAQRKETDGEIEYTVVISKL